ncbi:hypothetical protein JTE90_027001 [Oedothorax gibbosus]|uniref:RRM domain-containing protein n=1 Tax=Oedothorax gibbosus TaxID=931172 RepID=A0AAV6V9G1_9ARAC|nr:hypothetical protein JTE90_027001 [Oedothorax gibbosus]
MKPEPRAEGELNADEEVATGIEKFGVTGDRGLLGVIVEQDQDEAPPRKSPLGSQTQFFGSLRNKLPDDDLNPEDLDRRTKLRMRLSQRVQASNLEELLFCFELVRYVKVVMDKSTRRLKDYGFESFHCSKDAKKALEGLNGFEVAGRPIQVGRATEITDLGREPSFLDRSGIVLGATGRRQLLAKLMEGMDRDFSAATMPALQLSQGLVTSQRVITLPIDTKFFLLSIMFDPTWRYNVVYMIQKELCELG